MTMMMIFLLNETWFRKVEAGYQIDGHNRIYNFGRMASPVESSFTQSGSSNTIAEPLNRHCEDFNFLLDEATDGLIPCLKFFIREF